jgi:hypothetical protein
MDIIIRFGIGKTGSMNPGGMRTIALGTLEALSIGELGGRHTVL